MTRAVLRFAVLLAMYCLGASALDPNSGAPFVGDVGDVLDDARRLVREGKHKEALEKYIWFHEHALEYEEAMSGVRLSYAISEWKDLGDKYPPAMEALIAMRDKKTNLIKEGKGSFDLFHDVSSFNQYLESPALNVELFRHLDKTQPELAETCWIVAIDDVIAAKDYELAKRYIGDMNDRFIDIKYKYDMNVRLSKDKDIGGDHFKEWTKKSFVENCMQLIEVALAIGDKKTAQDIQTKALAVIDSPELRNAIKKEK